MPWWNSTGAWWATALGGGGASIPATNLVFNHDVSQLVATDLDPIGTLPDYTANSYDVTSAGGARPTYKAAFQNGKGVLQFNPSSTDDHMDGSRPVDDSFTFYCVFKFVDIGATGPYVVCSFHNSATTTRFSVWPALGNDNFRWSDNSAGGTVDLGGPALVDTWYIACIKMTDTTSMTIYINGSQVGSFNPHANIDGGQIFRYGKATTDVGVQMYLAHGAMYSDVHDDTQRGEVEDFFTDYWGL